MSLSGPYPYHCIHSRGDWSASILWTMLLDIVYSGAEILGGTVHVELGPAAGNVGRAGHGIAV